MQAPALDRAAQRAPPGTSSARLADDLVERARAHPHRQGRVPRRAGAAPRTAARARLTSRSILRPGRPKRTDALRGHDAPPRRSGPADGVTPMSAAAPGEAVELLRPLIRFDTVNPPGNERAAQEHLAGVLGDAGFECELLGRTPERPNLVARLDGARAGPRAVPALARRHGPRDAVGVDARPVVRRPRRRLRLGARRARHEVADRGGGRRGVLARARRLAPGARRAAGRRARRRGDRRRRGRAAG